MTTSSKSVLYFLAFLVVVAAGVAVYYHQAYVLALKDTPQGASAQQSAIISKIGQLIVLPQNETPTFATVVDPTALQSQPFFANASKGDVVLIYTSAKEAILYDPSMNKIVAVAPLTIGNSEQAPTPMPAPVAVAPSSTSSTTTTPTTTVKKK